MTDTEFIRNVNICPCKSAENSAFIICLHQSGIVFPSWKTDGLSGLIPAAAFSFAYIKKTCFSRSGFKTESVRYRRISD